MSGARIGLAADSPAWLFITQSLAVYLLHPIMKRTIFLLLGVVLILLLAGCHKLMTKALDEWVDEEKKAQARSYVQKLKDGQLDELASELQDVMKGEHRENIERLGNLRGYLPSGVPTGSEIVGYRVARSLNGVTTYQLAEQYDYGDKWVVATVIWRELPTNSTKLDGLYLNVLNQPLQKYNALTLCGKSLRHYVFGLLVLAIPAFSFTTLIVCIRTKFTGRKWLWILFILVSFGGLSLNWTTGQMDFQLLRVSLFGASAISSGLYAPWVLTLSFPLGAICFWLRRKPQPPQTTPPFVDHTLV